MTENKYLIISIKISKFNLSFIVSLLSIFPLFVSVFHSLPLSSLLHSSPLPPSIFLLLFCSPLPPSTAGPTTQTDVVKSAAPINQIITFDDSTTSILVEFNITDDNYALEPVETYNVSLSLIGTDSRIMFVSPQVTNVNIVDNDGNNFSYINSRANLQQQKHTDIPIYIMHVICLSMYITYNKIT